MEITKENIQTFAAKIKEAFAAFGEKQKFMDAKLADGTMVSIEGEALAQGVPVMVMTEAGAAPIPDGEYTLEDGTVFTVVGGTVAEVKAPAATTDQEMEQNGTGAANAAPSAPNPSQIIERIEKEMIFEKVSKIETLESQVADLVTKFAAIEKENAELKSEKAKFAATIEKLNQAVTELGEAPQEPMKFEKQPVKVKTFEEEVIEHRKKAFNH
jgi:uncharacterized coiled-coil protein SlyX